VAQAPPAARAAARIVKNRWLLLDRVRRRFVPALALLLALHVIGTAAYYVIGKGQYGALDALYMTFITIATIGYAEVIPLDQSPVGRLFTMFLGFVGIATTWYIFSQLTAFIVEGDINAALRRNRMLRSIARLSNHYIVCGIGRVGSIVGHELRVTERPFVVIDSNQAHIDAFRERYPDTLYLHGDASEDALLIDAGVQRAAGVFAVVGDDSKNLVITLSAKELNPGARVVARCHEVMFTEKIRRVGADAIISPDFTGAVHIASSMVRPQVETFLDQLLRSEQNLRVEEVIVPGRHDGKRLCDLEQGSRDHILLAIRSAGAWLFNPPPETPLHAGDVVVFMATPEGRRSVEARFNPGSTSTLHLPA
jgi:voltage-gated potassium channel